jgi:hypothetical protein
MIRGQSLICEFTQQEATYTLRDGEGLTVYHQCKPLQLSQGNPVTVPIETAETPEPVAL